MLHESPDPKLNEVQHEWASVGVGLGPGGTRQRNCTQSLGRKEAHTTHLIAISKRVLLGYLDIDFSLKTL